MLLKCLILFCVFIEVPTVSLWSNNISPWSLLSRIKRQNEERWNWSSGDAAPKSNNVDVATSTAAVVTDESNPCFVSEPPVAPNFTAPGRRISQVKCFEYMWTVRLIIEEAQKNAECADLLLDIIGGREAVAQEFPHMAAIGWKAAQGGGWLFKCGGSLISTKFVLTAAHCSKASDRDTTLGERDPKIVRLGQVNIEKITTGQDVNILRIINHPEYKAPKKYFDVALLELEKQITFNEYVQPACLYTGTDKALIGQKAIISGWGVLDEGSINTSPNLQTAEVDVLDSRLCDRVYKPTCNRLWCGMTQNQLCAGNIEGGVDACQGDSGGPLQTKIALPATSIQANIYRIIGVTSFGIGCARANVPGIYSRVSSYLDWIEGVVWKKA